MDNDDTKNEFDFSRGTRGAVLPPSRGKERITIRLDREVLEWFRQQARVENGWTYQTLINDALRDYIESRQEPLEERLRRVVREELAQSAQREKPGTSNRVSLSQNRQAVIPKQRNNERPRKMKTYGGNKISYRVEKTDDGRIKVYVLNKNEGVHQLIRNNVARPSFFYGRAANLKKSGIMARRWLGHVIADYSEYFREGGVDFIFK